MGTKEALYDLRVNSGLSQDELAGKLYVTRQAVSRWETGKTVPNIDTLKLMSQEFGVSINELLGLEEGSACQSCAMTFHQAEDFGTQEDGSANVEYCTHCFQNGNFTHERTLDEMIESNLKHLDEFNAESGTNFDENQARTILREHLATLKRWQDAPR